MKQTLQYDQTSCRLQVEGLPDVSLGHAAGAVGILTGWRLELLGHPSLSGQRDQLLALLQVVLPYIRYRISGVPRGFGEDRDALRLLPEGSDRHRLVSRLDAASAPQELILDDAELADLAQVLDRLRLDPRLRLEVDLPPPQPLPARELIERIPRRRRLAAPAGGLAALALAAALGALWPPPRPGNTPSPGAAASSTPAPAPTSQPPSR